MHPDRTKHETFGSSTEPNYRQIFENTIEGIYQTTADGRFLSASPALARMLGYASVAELIADRTDIGRQGYVDPARREEFKRVLAAQSKVQDFQYEVWRKDGRRIWVSENARAVCAADGTFQYYEGSMIDISARRDAEAKLHAKQAQLLEALRIARLAYWEYDVLRDEFEFNDQFYAILRTTAEREGGYRMSSAHYARRFVHPEDLHMVGEEIGRALATTDPNFSREIDHRVIFGDGEVGHITVHVRVEKDAAGRTIRTHGANIDITQRKRAELRFRDLFESAPDALLLLTAEGEITDVNLRALKLFGFTREEMLGHGAELLIPPEQQPIFLQDLADLARPGKSASPTGRSLTARSKDGRVFPVDVSFSPLRSGPDQRVIAALRDTTEQHRAQEQQRTLELQLRQSQKTEALGTLAGGIAHDFNNLLTAILGHTDLALGDLSPNHAATANLLAVRQAGLRSRDLVKQILTFSRRSETARAPLRLQDALQDALLLMRSTIPAMVRIERIIDRQCPPVFGDATQLNQVLMNLCTNAWHALPVSGGVIEIRLESCAFAAGTGQGPRDLAPGRYVRLSVKDNGHGMPPETLERIYDPFFTTKPVGQGTGLGLSVVHGIVKAHDGTIYASSSPGRGTTIDVYFPVVPSAAGAPAVFVGEVARGEGESILYVDDDELAAGAVTGLLRRLGYRVSHRALPGDALELFWSAPKAHDLVITDFAMPGMPGTELAAKLRRIRADVPVLLITGFIGDLDSSVARANGVREVLRKPVSFEALAAAVHRALGKSGAPASP